MPEDEETDNYSGTLQPCQGLQILIDRGIVKVTTENIDDKGLTNTVTLGDFVIKYCPVCGQKICNVEVPQGECYNPDLPENRCPECETIMLMGPDGFWCPQCNPDAPGKFHVEEATTHLK